MTRERLQSVSTGNEDIYITKQKWKSRLFVIRKYLFLVCVIINRKFWSNFWTTNLLFEVWYLICSNELSWLLAVAHKNSSLMDPACLSISSDWGQTFLPQKQNTSHHQLLTFYSKILFISETVATNRVGQLHTGSN